LRGLRFTEGFSAFCRLIRFDKRGRRRRRSLPREVLRELEQARPLLQGLGRAGGLTRASRMTAEERAKQAKVASKKRGRGIPLGARQAQGRAAAQAHWAAWRAAGKPSLRRRKKKEMPSPKRAKASIPDTSEPPAVVCAASDAAGHVTERERSRGGILWETTLPHLTSIARIRSAR
jgi:hypothetical protein